MITSNQIRAARALLRIDQTSLARDAGISVVTLRRLEEQHGLSKVAPATVDRVRLALETAQDYVATRKQFGRPIGEFQALQFRLADMATDLEAARLMVLRGAWAIDADHPEKTKWCAMAKRLATDACFHIADEALQLHGGYGYLKDYPLERIVRDLRVHQILEGTNEIMRVIVSREILGR